MYGAERSLVPISHIPISVASRAVEIGQVIDLMMSSQLQLVTRSIFDMQAKCFASRKRHGLNANNCKYLHQANSPSACDHRP